LNFKIAVACGLFVYLCKKVRGLRVLKKRARLNIVSKLHDSTLPSLEVFRARFSLRRKFRVG
jgi:hypothetical protein